MSSPIRQLRNLRIGDMPIIRSQRRVMEQRRRETEASDRVLPSVEVPGPNPVVQDGSHPPTVLQGHSGTGYDFQNLDPISQQRTLEGLTAEFDIRRSTDFGSYYAIQLHRSIRVCIYDPSNCDEPVTCTCGDANPVCAHITVRLSHVLQLSTQQLSSKQWLFDRLTAAVVGWNSSVRRTLTTEGIVSGISALYRTIREDANLQRLLRVSRDEYAESESESESDEEMNTHRSERDLTELKRSLQDMLSVFDPALPREYGRAFVDRVPQLFCRKLGCNCLLDSPLR